MDRLIEQRDSKLRQWNASTAQEVRQRVTENMDLADHDSLDIGRSRELEQNVLDMLDEPISR